MLKSLSEFIQLNTKNKVYTGIGSRRTPRPILEAMVDKAFALAELGYTLRSGGANGADAAFEVGHCMKHRQNMEIYIPWKGFSNLKHAQTIIIPDQGEHFQIAKQYHPAWDKCSPGAKKLHARNVFQVLGKDLKSPTDFIICWTEGGTGAGGTGQALRIAKAYNIPVFDMGKFKYETQELFQ